MINLAVSRSLLHHWINKLAYLYHWCLSKKKKKMNLHARSATWPQLAGRKRKLEWEPVPKRKRYTTGKLLGFGGEGTVYTARDSEGNHLAVKVLETDKICQWERGIPREVAVLHRLQGVKGVIRLTDYFVKGQLHHLVLERPEGAVDLFDYVEREGSVLEETARVIFSRLLEILRDVHRRGVVHLDVKEENVLIHPSTKEVWLIDFGTSRYAGNDYLSTLPGTKENAPPEYFRHKKYRPKHAEVWALGVLLYGMLTGETAFPTPRATCSKKIKLPKNCFSEEVVQVVSQALDKDPKRRATLEQLLASPWVNK